MARLTVLIFSTILALSPLAEAQVVYQRLASVTNYLNIAQDLKVIEAKLAIGTQEGRDAAFNIYTKGAYSMPYANLTLVPPLSSDEIKKDTVILGQTFDGNEVEGIIMADAVRGDSVLQVLYAFRPDEERKNMCFVGGIPQPITKGCFQSKGDLFINNKMFTYSHNTLQDTHNAITLQSLSLEAEDDMTISEGRYFQMFRRYNKYYGRPDYGNEWINSAFSNIDTDFLDGNAGFEGYDKEGSAEAIVTGITVLNIWMYVIRQMEFSYDKCMQSCVGCQDQSLRAWDIAVAFYTGSITKSPSDNGILHYTLVQTMCETFGTCKNGLNDKIYTLFNEAKDSILDDRCDPVGKNIKMIESLMTVPLVQGMLYEVYREDRFADANKRVEAKGATFAAAVLPQVAFCNSNWASAIYKTVRIGYDRRTSFEVVKDAIERQYECMKITCEDIGGIVRPGGGYFDNAEPCGEYLSQLASASSNSDSDSNSGPNSAAIGGIAGGAFAVVLFSVLVLTRKKRREKSVEEPVDLKMTTQTEEADNKIV